MENPEEMTYEERSTEIEALLYRIIELQKLNTFVEEYQSQATNEETLGVTMANFFEWSGKKLYLVLSSALEDANYHSGSALMDRLAESSNEERIEEKILAFLEGE